MGIALISLSVAMLLVPLAKADGNDHPGKEGFTRCAACHLAQGQGIPGAFPPIRGRIAQTATQEAGRAYLVAVVNAGLIGHISVNGLSYFGVMPAQGNTYDAKGISDVLNYAIQVLDRNNVKTEWTPYSEEEVAKLMGKDAPVSGQDVARLRKTLAHEHPELF